jgi:GNAT superfamily N-acetyltransferase
MNDALPHADLALARRLERTEGLACAAIVLARGRLAPESGATWQDFGGSCAMYDGDGSPMTQAFGFGLHDDATVEGVSAIEAFFHAHGARTVLDSSLLGGLAMTALLQDRGYRITEMSSVLYRATTGGVPGMRATSSSLTVRAVNVDETAHWTDIAAAGWGADTPEVADYIRQLGPSIMHARGMISFLAEFDGESIGSASMFLGDGAALLAGASTVAHARGRGAQSALLAARLAYAADHGLPLAMVATEPGSRSQRNAERQGFRVAYTRCKWREPGQSP